MMMAEYIEREAAIREMYKEPSYYDPVNILTEVRDRIKAIPAADVRPVVRGKWKTNSNFPDTLICSECDAKFDMWKWERKKMCFCPSCGAKMKGAEENHTMDEFMYGQEMGSHSDGSL